MNLATRALQNGFSLIELSVAAGIYSLGLGSLSLLMLLAVRGTAESAQESAAAMEAASLAEAIQLTSDAAGHYALLPGELGASCDPAVSCSPQEMAAWQLSAWRERLAARLPGGHGVVCQDATPRDGDSSDASCDGSGATVIKVFWSQPPAAVDTPDPQGRYVLRLP